MLFNTTRTQQNSIHTDAIQTVNTNTQQQPSTSTYTHDNNFSSIEFNKPGSIISQVDCYTNVLSSSSFSAVPAFSDNQKKSYTDLEVKSLTSPNSTMIQHSSMIEPLTYDSSYIEPQVMF